jgi:iron(III) transport system permease protein
MRHAIWSIPVVVIGALFSAPLLTVVSSIFFGVGENWAHLADTVLAEYVINSLVLMAGVGAGTLLLGVAGAWLTSVCEFPGRRAFQWMLLLPLAVPAYIIAYTYTGLLDYAGPVQEALRAAFPGSAGHFPEVRSLPGAVTMFSLVLYPYVYLLSRAAFLEQSSVTLEASRSLGYGIWRSFFSVALPLARPAIITGLALALMETLADFGTVQYFGVSTFTTGIFRTWFGLGDERSATQLSALLLLFVFALITMESYSRRRARFYQQHARQMRTKRLHLTGARGALAFATCGVPFLFGFLIPFVQLVVWSVQTADTMLDLAFVVLALHSLALAATTAILALLLALLLAYGKRLYPLPLVLAATRVASMGYAIPGTIIAIGVILPFAWIDNTVDGFARDTWNFSTGLLLSGTLFALVFAYLVRFLAVSFGTIDAALLKIKPSLDDAARTLGQGPRATLVRVHLPLLRTGLLTSVLLVFVDVMKELPATLLLRPFNFNTLAVRAYELASDERLQDAASASIMIVLTGLIPVLMLSASISRGSR